VLLKKYVRAGSGELWVDGEEVGGEFSPVVH